MKKVKLCILQNGLARGGTDTFVVNLCRGLDKDKYDVTVVNPCEKPDLRVREQEVLSSGAKIFHTHPLEGLMGRLKHLYRLFCLLKKGKFDVFQTNIDLFNGPQLLVAWLAGVPVRCCHSHNGMQQKSIIHGMTLPIHIYQATMKWMCWKFANRHCGCSDYANNFLYAGKDWSNVSYPAIINNGIDIQHYRTTIDIDGLKKSLGLARRYNILIVGRIIPQKNPLFIAEIFSELCKSRDDVDLVWISDGPLKEKCVKVFKSNRILDHVHFLGFRSDVAQIMQCCDLFLMPSIFEGLPLVLVESQAAGMPCLVSTNITKQADCGAIMYLSLDTPTADWVKAMSDIIDGRMVLNTSEEKLERFSINYMVNQMEQVFKN